ncbi:MAG TPA: hypothetical protein VHB25_04300 [Gemmatimonadaceae bacterium]|nr:hypothetical protein [Gemmatimonadaceae bacterium]
MALQYTITPLPAVWPGPKAAPRRSPFKTQWTKTLTMLEREIRHLRGTHVEFAVDVRGPRDINQNGTLRADARPAARVIVSFRLPSGKRLQFPCGTFAFWQDNVYAIAKALEALRMVERYGVSSTSQYEGFKALPGAGGTIATLSTNQAATLIARLADDEGNTAAVLSSRDWAKALIRRAKARTHPDAGGRNEDWTLLQEAERIITAHHGGAL